MFWKPFSAARCFSCSFSRSVIRITRLLVSLSVVTGFFLFLPNLLSPPSEKNSRFFHSLILLIRKFCSFRIRSTTLRFHTPDSETLCYQFRSISPLFRTPDPVISKYSYFHSHNGRSNFRFHLSENTPDPEILCYQFRSILSFPGTPDPETPSLCNNLFIISKIRILHYKMHLVRGYP